MPKKLILNNDKYPWIQGLIFDFLKNKKKT